MMTHTCKLTLSYVKALPKYITITYGIILVVWYVLQLRPHNMYIHIHRKTKFHFTGQNLTLVKNICEVTWLPVLPLPTELASILFTVQQSCRIWLASWDVQGHWGTHTGGRWTDGGRDLHRCIELLPFYLTGQSREEIWFCCDNWSAGFRMALYLSCLLL